MKYRLLSVVVAAIAIAAMPSAASAADPECNVPVGLKIENPDNTVPQNALSNLSSIITTALSNNGLGGDPALSNFCINAEVVPEGQENIAGLRPVVAVVARLNMELCNTATGEKFCASSFEIRGGGANAAAAYNAAVRDLRSRNNDLKQFMDRAQQTVMNYYNRHLIEILRQARSKNMNGNAEEAIWLLCTVPPCVDGYNDVEECMNEIYQSYADREGARLLAQARIAWDTGRDLSAAGEAAALLRQIDPSSASFPGALEFAREIRDRIAAESEYARERDDRMWEFARELELSDIDLERARIEAARQIGIAYGENQRATVIQNINGTEPER